MSTKAKSKTKKSKRPKYFRQNVEDVEVTAADLTRANNAIAAFKEAHPDDEPGGGLEIIIGEFHKEVALPDIPDDELVSKMRIEKVMAIYERLVALSNMSPDALKGYQMKGGDKFDYIELSAFEAAARAKLYRADRKASWFDPEEFKRLALEFREPDANA